jgi:hypothetical protein
VEQEEKPEQKEDEFRWESPAEAAEEILCFHKDLRELLEPILADLEKQDLTHAYGHSIAQLLQVMEEDLTALRNHLAG